MSLVILIGRRDNLSIKKIGTYLARINIRYLVLDEFTISDFFSISISNYNASGFIKYDKKQIDFREIRSIWNSSHIIIRTEKIKPSARDFAAKEWEEGINSIYGMTDVLWVNHPFVLNTYSNRLKQLQLASMVGLSIPKTLITNDPEQLLSFIKSNHKVVAKTLNNSSGLRKNHIIFTSELRENDIKNADTLKYVPTFFQEFLEKNKEFRVIIIGEKLHVCEISYSTKICDYRSLKFSDIKHTKSSLPDDIINKLILLKRKMNLEFAAVDLLQTSRDEIVFLEVNPNGRWLWIQQQTGMDISKDIALHLAVCLYLKLIYFLLCKT